MRKKIAIFGSTGSIGTQVLACLRFLEHEYEVFALTCNTSKSLFEEQKREWNPKITVVASECEDPEIELERVVMNSEVDCVVNALSGSAGVSLTEAAIRARKTIFLANKESLVMKGEEFMKRAQGGGGTIVPLDSEAAGVWQLLRCDDSTAHRDHREKGVVPRLCPEKMSQLQSVTITASGGPFFGYTREQLATVTREQALNHPTWKMGAKISIESATLVNKAFEVIECARLFDLREDQIRVRVDRTSFIHAGVEYVDGTMQWVSYPPDMRIPIYDALLFATEGVSLEQYRPQAPQIVSSVDVAQLGTVDEKVFTAIAQARPLIARGDAACADFCRAKESSVEAFLRNEIPFSSLLSL